MKKPYDVALIFAAGDGGRWGWHEDIPKQLVQVCGETVLGRQIRILRDRGADQVYVITHDPRLCLPGAGFFSPADRTFLASSVLSTRQFWRGRILGVCGDAWIDDETFDEILASRDGIRWYGRADTSPLTGGPGEVWAWAWSDVDNAALARAFEVAISHAHSIGLQRDAAGSPVAGLWQPYRLLAHTGPIDVHRVEADVWVECGGWSDDFDWPERLDEWRRRRQAAGLPI